MWEVLCGTLEVVRDLELEDLGRKRFHGRRNPDFSPEGYVALSGRQLFRLAFAVRRVPWRLAMIEVETDYAIPGMPREDDVALVAWVAGLTTIIRGDPPVAELLGPDDGTRGDNSLGRLLQPEPLEVVVHPPWARHFEIAGSTLETDEAMFAAPGLITDPTATRRSSTGTSGSSPRGRHTSTMVLPLASESRRSLLFGYLHPDNPAPDHHSFATAIPRPERRLRCLPLGSGQWSCL